MNIREELEMYGLQDMSTRDLLAFLIGGISDRGADHARRLLTNYSLNQLMRLDWPELMAEGLTKPQAQRVTAIGELMRRGDLREKPAVRLASEAHTVLKPYLYNLDHEELRCLYLNTRCEVEANLLLYKGTVNSTCLRPAEILRPAISRNCPAIIMAHNHPSGDPTPSQEDKDITLQTVEAGKYMEIEVLDHIVIGNGHFKSLKQMLNW